MTPDPRLELIEAELAAYLLTEDVSEPLHATRTLDTEGPPSSVHAVGRARDYRTRGWPPGVAGRAAVHLSRVFSRHGQDPYATAIYETPETHPRATGPHLHVQVPPYPTPEWVGELVAPMEGPA